METTKPFPLALRELLVDTEFVTQTGNPNWAAFAAELVGVHYETVRQAATGRRRPTPRLIEECARALRVRPHHFLEYRIHMAQLEFEPSVVGYDRALENLALWAEVREATPSGSKPSSASTKRTRTQKVRK